jgi:cytochrome c peroxidase/6-phosphogluconolactonase (cycloisomerase 2 family)
VPGAGELYRSPVDVVLAADEQWMVTANQTSNSISLIHVATGKVQDELSELAHPGTVVRCLDGQHVAVSCSYAGQVVVVRVDDGKFEKRATIEVGYEPIGLAVSPSGRIAYVALAAAGEVAELDLETAQVTRRFPVGPWPRYLTVSPDGSRLAVGCSGDSKVAVVDVSEGGDGEVLYRQNLTGAINLGHMQCSDDGQYVYFPWMVYRSNPITTRNIRLGWVLASRIARVRLDGAAYREAISLDVPRLAVSDPHGLVLSHDQQRLVVSASGTHELLVYRNPDLPYVGTGGPGDLIDRKLLDDNDLFYRIDVGGRPMGMEISRDNRTVYVANFLNDSIQQVDIVSRQIVRELRLSDAASDPALMPLERHGMALFYDGQRSLDQWYSCHSCHYNGGTNSKSMDTNNDGTELTMKTVLPLYHVHATSPWTWHGWQQDLRHAMQTSFTETMQGDGISEQETDAILAYLETLQPPPNPHRAADGSLSESARRGEAIFHSERAACATCHAGPHFTDGQIHDVGLGRASDRYQGYNTPSLLGLYRKTRFLHDGRAKSLDDLLTGPHAPSKVAGEADLTADERSDLIEYLKSL